MKIIRPTTITPAMLASDITETDYAEYSAATVYALGAKVIVVATHHIYESLQASNTGHYPPDNLTGTTPYWLDCGATNKWRPFDAKVSTQASKATSINYSIAAGVIDSLALMGMDATSVVLTLTDPLEGVVYSKSIDLISTSGVIDGYTYCFEPIIMRTDTCVFDIPPYGAATLSITVTNTGGNAKVGEIVVGQQAYLGGTEYDPSIGITDYSKKEADDFGDYAIVERAYSRKISCTLFLDNAWIDEVYRLLAKYRATPLIWEAAEGYSALVYYGFYKSFDITIPYPTNSTCSLEIEGLT